MDNNNGNKNTKDIEQTNNNLNYEENYENDNFTLHKTESQDLEIVDSPSCENSQNNVLT